VWSGQSLNSALCSANETCVLVRVSELVRDMDKKLHYHYDICAKKHRGVRHYQR
jgi:hypothetical protein